MRTFIAVVALVAGACAINLSGTGAVGPKGKQDAPTPVKKIADAKASSEALKKAAAASKSIPSGMNFSSCKRERVGNYSAAHLSSTTTRRRRGRRHLPLVLF